jgi:hypothetical protein
VGCVDGVVAATRAKRPYKAPQTEAIAPWRDLRWRTLLKRQLGAQAPNDINLIPDGIFNQRIEMINLTPEAQRPVALHALNQEKLLTEIDDANWQQWYDHYHRIVLSVTRWDFESHVRYGIIYNLQAAAVYVLISAIFVPNIRHWWTLVPASIWAVIFVFQEYYRSKEYMKAWSTLSEQIRYLDHRNRNLAS